MTALARKPQRYAILKDLQNELGDGVGEPEKPFSVLVTDDEPGLLTGLQQVLASHGYQVGIATDGARAMAALTDDHYDILLLDLAMPGVPGAAVLDFVMERGLDLAVIVISGATSVAEATTAMRRGAIDYLRKPLGPEELLGSLANSVRKLRLERGHRILRGRLEASERLHRLIVDRSPDLIFLLDVEGRLVYHNQKVKECLGFEPATLFGQSLLDLVAPADQGEALRLLRHLAEETSQPQVVELRLLCADSRPVGTGQVLDPLVIVEITASAILENHETPPRCAGSYMVARDITDRRRTEEALRRTNARLEHVVRASPAVIYSRAPGPGMPIGFISANVVDLLGYSADELLADPEFLISLAHPDDRARFRQGLDIEEGLRQGSCEYRLLHRQGGWRWIRDTVRPICDAEGRPMELVGSWLDHTEAQLLAAQLTHQASHDFLTGLPNRYAFEHRVHQALEIAQKQNVEHALLYLDLDQFKIINDTCGHLAGDTLLRQLSQLLQTRVRRQDVLARLGGDEFGVLMEYCPLPDAMRVANSLCKAVSEYRFAWGDKTFQVGVSIGVAPIHAGSDSLNSVLRAADSACYAAKDAGRNRAHLYAENDAELARRQGELQWVARINHALENNRFQLAFQPIVPTGLGQLEGQRYELLLRMEDESGQLVMPGAFLPAAERYHLAVKLDRWVIGTALDWLIEHPGHLDRLALCSMNLSGHSLEDEALLGYLIQRLSGQQALAGKICFEITETAAIANLYQALHFIHALKDLGCRFALDDFGSGLSSLAYLKKLPVDFLKIDGVFMEDIAHDPVSLAMVSSINEIGHVMGMKTIAEFVENDQILAQLRGIGVNYAQGYGIGKPRPLTELALNKPP